jgi:hypothetical protein
MRTMLAALVALGVIAAAAATVPADATHYTKQLFDNLDRQKY